jgi:hypothetical protein
MSSVTSTERARAARPRRAEAPADAGFRPWQFFVLGSLAAATIAVMLARDTHPVALLVLSAGVLAAGFAGWAIQQAVAAFSGGGAEQTPVAGRGRQALEREKLLVLRAIKDLEFDHSMKKISDADFADLSTRLRARALTLMQELETASAGSEPAESKGSEVAAHAGYCAKCGTPHDDDARFCKQCGAQL